MWNIKELSLKQQLFFPSFITGIIGHLLVYLILTLGFHFTFVWFQKAGEPIEISLYRSFKKVKRVKAVPRGARKIVPLEEVPAEVPREVVREEAVEKADEDVRSGSAWETYLGSIYRRIENRKYYPEIEKDRCHEGIVKVGFVVKRDGVLEKAWIVKSCRYRGLNRAALQTVKRAAPFMPIPEQFKGAELPIVIDVVYKII